MNVLEFLRHLVTEAARILSYGASVQGAQRAELVAAVQGICDRSEAAYGQLVARLRPVKDAFFDRAALSRELRAFASDPGARDAFKPARLCGEAAVILDRLENNLDPLKYSIDARKVTALKMRMREFDNTDRAFLETFDRFASDLDALATQLSDPALADPAERLAYARRVVQEFEEDIRATLRDVRDARAALLGA